MSPGKELQPQNIKKNQTIKKEKIQLPWTGNPTTDLARFNLVDPHVRNTIETPPGGRVGPYKKKIKIKLKKWENNKNQTF